MPVIVRNMISGKGETYETGAVMASIGLMEIMFGTGSLANVIRTVTIVRFDDIQAAHWELYLQGDGPSVKIDLMEAGYRILYGANPRVGRDGSMDNITLNPTKTLGEVIALVVRVATMRGDWTGTDQYNCQDFVILFLAALGVSASEIMRYELRRFVTKHIPPVVTDTDMHGNLRTRI